MLKITLQLLITVETNCPREIRTVIAEKLPRWWILADSGQFQLVCRYFWGGFRYFVPVVQLLKFPPLLPSPPQLNARQWTRPVFG